jgi:hypothetical protein
MSRVVTLVDYSISSLTGSSQSLVSKDSTRSFILVHNPGSANIGVNPTGGTAAIGSAGTITLVPNGTMTFNIDGIPANAMTVIGTSGNPVTVITSP